MRRSSLAFLLTLLLLAFQQQVAVHTLEHVGARQPAGLTPPVDGTAHCLTCDLLAAGTDSLASSALASQIAAAAPTVAPAPYSSRAVAAPVVYASRAPPVLH